MNTLQLLEEKRKKTMQTMLLGYGICIGIALLVMLISMSFPFGLIAFVISLIVAEASVINGARNEFVLEYKRILLEGQLKEVFDDIQVDFERGFSEDEVEGWCLVDTHERFYSDDYVTGSYHGIQFRRSDVKIQDVRRSGKNTTVVTTFEGPWMIFEFGKRFTHYTVVKEKEFLDNGIPGGFWSGYEAEKIQTEDMRFNDKFVVFSTDGQEAFYLLNPTMMEKIIELESRLEGRLYLGFIDGEFHVALDNRENAFEPSVFEEISNYSINRVRDEIEAIKELVELVESVC